MTRGLYRTGLISHLTFTVLHYQPLLCCSYTVQAGHNYGAHFVLYEGPPDEYHSRYCVHVMGCSGGGDSWGHMKTMSRLMPVRVISVVVGAKQ